MSPLRRPVRAARRVEAVASPSRLRRDREKAATRALILEAARELFTREGYAETSMRRLAETIGYTATTIYHHFKDKDALLNELCLNDFRALGEALRHMEQVSDPIARIRAMGVNYVRFALEHPQQFRFMFMVERPVPGPDEVQIDPAEDGYVFLKTAVAEAISAGLLKEDLHDVESVSQIMWGIVHGIATIHLSKGHDQHPWIELRDPMATARLACDTLMQGMLRNP
ncbi:MAG: TetR/AcrR family transcriptional regulator [Gemmatimonadetes bacterium]|nr:TetR/AcrR family transcriptional regulator [Gemmatimonadota bacterium]